MEPKMSSNAMLAKSAPFASAVLLTSFLLLADICAFVRIAQRQRTGKFAQFAGQ